MKIKNTILSGAEHLVSKFGHPDVAIAASNRLIENQSITGYKSASIGRNCELRGDIHLGKGVDIANGCTLRFNATLGRYSRLGANSEMIGDVSIGKFSPIARRVTFQQLNHPMDKPSMSMTFYERVLDGKLKHVSKGPINIGSDTWIGMDTIVLPGVTIGDGAVVGSGSVVTQDVKPYEVVAGVPAKQIKWRFPEDIREKLLEISWWDWSITRLKENKEFFEKSIDSVTDIEDIS